MDAEVKDVMKNLIRYGDFHVRFTRKCHISQLGLNTNFWIKFIRMIEVQTPIDGHELQRFFNCLGRKRLYQKYYCRKFPQLVGTSNMADELASLLLQQTLCPVLFGISACMFTFAIGGCFLINTGVYNFQAYFAR